VIAVRHPGRASSGLRTSQSEPPVLVRVHTALPPSFTQQHLTLGRDSGAETPTVPARLVPNPLGHVGPLTVGTALGRYCDLLSPPRRNSLAALAAFANSEKEAKELRRLAGKEGKEVLAKWFKEGISLVEVCVVCFPFPTSFVCPLTHSLETRETRCLSVSLVQSSLNVDPVHVKRRAHEQCKAWSRFLNSNLNSRSVVESQLLQIVPRAPKQGTNF